MVMCKCFLIFIYFYLLYRYIYFRLSSSETHSMDCGNSLSYSIGYLVVIQMIELNSICTVFAERVLHQLIRMTINISCVSIPHRNRAHVEETPGAICKCPNNQIKKLAFLLNSKLLVSFDKRRDMLRLFRYWHPPLFCCKMNIMNTLKACDNNQVIMYCVMRNNGFL